MAITRRQFLKHTGLVTAGGFLGPGLFANPLVRRALAETIGDRYFVVLFLDGGNDGLNTVVPVTNGGGTLRTAYEAARGTGGGGLRLTPDDLAATLIGTDFNTGAQLALHPGLRGFAGAPGYGGLKALYDAGKVAVLQGCGYPDYSLSHEESRIIWQTADPLGANGFGTGWMGRYLAANYLGGDIPGVTIDDAVAGELRQTTTSVLAIRRLRDFGFPYDDFDDADDAAKRTAFLALYQEASQPGAHPALQLIGGSGAATLSASESYPALHDAYEADRGSWSQQYADVDRSTARDLREVAKVIYGVSQGAPNVHARFFQVSNGGYDTHADQGAAAPNGQHFDLHAEVAAAIKVFYDDCADMGVADKVVLLVWSEFSRRIPQNSNGTDHGSQGPMLVIGGKVNGGVYGSHPNIAPAALDGEGNTVYRQDAHPFRSIDFRDVYGTTLKHWLNMPHGTITSGVLPLDTGPAQDYWTVENFDLAHPGNGQPLYLP
jgi:uncharacterized protein (DUF1501 family)